MEMENMSKTSYNQNYLNKINNNLITNNADQIQSEIQMHMNKTNYNQGFLNKNKGEWPGLVPCKFPNSKKIVERPNTTGDYYLSIII